MEWLADNSSAADIEKLSNLGQQSELSLVDLLILKGIKDLKASGGGENSVGGGASVKAELPPVVVARSPPDFGPGSLTGRSVDSMNSAFSLGSINTTATNATTQSQFPMWH